MLPSGGRGIQDEQTLLSICNLFSRALKPVNGKEQQINGENGQQNLIRNRTLLSVGALLP